MRFTMLHLFAHIFVYRRNHYCHRIFKLKFTRGAPIDLSCLSTRSSTRSIFCPSSTVHHGCNQFRH